MKLGNVVFVLVAQALLLFPLQAFHLRAAFVVTAATRWDESVRTAKPRYGRRRRVREHQLDIIIRCHSDSYQEVHAATTTPFSYIPDESVATRKFLDFLQAEECEGLEGLEIGFSAPQQLQPQHQQHGVSRLRGIFSKEPFHVGDFLCAIPFVSSCVVGEEEIILEAVEEGNDDLLPQLSIEMTDAAKGLAFLQNVSVNPKWQPYVSCLPTPLVHFDATPDFWTDEELEQLEIPHVIESARDRREQIQALANSAGLDTDSLQFATWLVTSRAFTTIKPIMNGATGGESLQDQATTLRMRSVLIPFLDMINHSTSRPNAEIEVVDTKEDDESFYALRAIRPIQAGEQILITYGTGRESSIDLLFRYGFVSTQDDVNPNDTTEGCNTAWSTTLTRDQELLVSADGMLKKILEVRILMKQLQQQIEIGN